MLHIYLAQEGSVRQTGQEGAGVVRGRIVTACHHAQNTSTKVLARIPLQRCAGAYLPDRCVTLILKGVRMLELLPLHFGCGSSSTALRGMCTV
eukprot:scaffold79936_cov28-Tisochrysis_lutea.AAC.1